MPRVGVWLCEGGLASIESVTGTWECGWLREGGEGVLVVYIRGGKVEETCQTEVIVRFDGGKR
jgi:hypothetical protein